MRHLSILYRGTLSSCNYGCKYCPFAMRRETREQLISDQRDLETFTEWVTRQAMEISVFFTPWGEALIRKSYQQALVQLTNLPNVKKAAIQTNLSCKLEWISQCNRSKLGLWCTYHPGETSREKFLQQCLELDTRGVRYSVGIVGMKDHLEEAEALRHEIRPEVYVWINAYKRLKDYYTQEDQTRLEDIDPLFQINNAYHDSLGHDCATGHSVISVAGDGSFTRCHFIKTIIGNIYDSRFESLLSRTPCTNQTCGCHIGYVHLDHLNLQRTFGDGLLERIPRMPLDILE